MYLPLVSLVRAPQARDKQRRGWYEPGADAGKLGDSGRRVEQLNVLFGMEASHFQMPPLTAGGVIHGGWAVWESRTFAPKARSIFLALVLPVAVFLAALG